MLISERLVHRLGVLKAVLHMWLYFRWWKFGEAEISNNTKELAQERTQQSLVGHCRDPVPRPVERIQYGRAEHVVQVYLCRLEKRFT